MFILRVLLFMSLMHVALSHRSGQFHLHSREDCFVKLLKNLSYKMQSHRFPKSVNASGLFLILLLGGDIAVNPGTAMGVVNVRSIRNKGVVISNNTILTSYASLRHTSAPQTLIVS